MSERIEVKGVEKVIKKLNSFDDPAAMRRAMDKSLQHIQRRIAKYPPKPPSSRYRRTGTLGRGWTTKIENGGKRGIVGNSIPYAPKVQGPNQKPIFRVIGWATIGKVARDEGPAVIGYFEDEIRKKVNA